MTTIITTALRNLLAATAMTLFATSARTGWSAETASGDPEQTKFGAGVSKAEDAAKKAAHEALGSVAKEAEKALKRAGAEAAGTAARASRAAATKAAAEANRAEDVADEGRR